MSAPLIDRAFVRLAEGLVHYRYAGDAASNIPLYLAHAGPGSSRAMGPLMAALAASRYVIAPDMLGNGDSAPPARDDTDIAYYADSVVRIMDQLGFDQIDFYGTHTGAAIGAELAVRHPTRVRRVALDSVMLLDAAAREKMLANYAPKMQPDDHGGYLNWAYQFCRDMMIFFPYFERNPAHATGNNVPDAAFLHPMLVDVLKALTTYHCAYNAAFRHDTAGVLAKVKHPVLLTSSARDPLHPYLPRAAALLPSAATHLHPATVTPQDIAARLLAFFDAAAD